MHLPGIVALVGVIALAGCVSGEKPLVSGGPTPSQAIAAILQNPRVADAQLADRVAEKVRLDATECAVHPNKVVTCRVRIYTLGRGWSAPSMGRFTPNEGGWSFDF